MKQIILFAVLCIAQIAAQDFFPLEIGNTWSYSSHLPYKVTYKIIDTARIDGEKYFCYKNMTWNIMPIDTIRKDNDGKIWKHVNGNDHLWLDFTKEVGATYTFPFLNDSLEYFDVQVIDKNGLVETSKGNYTECYKVFFDNPHSVDEEVFYSFAPAVGIVEIYYGEGPHFLLDSLSLNVTLNVENTQQSNLNFYVLSQNYPNPFNPTTKIKYSIVQNGLVKLLIFDLLGREVASLVNTEQSIGNYEVDFNASTLTSGIYFYKLQSGNFSETRKMLLLR